MFSKFDVVIKPTWEVWLRGWGSGYPRAAGIDTGEVFGMEGFEGDCEGG